jgi:hypothetical protein
MLVSFELRPVVPLPNPHQTDSDALGVLLSQEVEIIAVQTLICRRVISAPVMLVWKAPHLYRQMLKSRVDIENTTLMSLALMTLFGSVNVTVSESEDIRTIVTPGVKTTMPVGY